MKLLRLFFLLTLGLGLLTVTSRVVASPVDLSPAAQGTTTPGAAATAISERMATLQAMQNQGKAEHFVGTISAVNSKEFTLTLRDGSSATILLSPNTRAIALATDGRPRPANLAVGQTALVRAVRDANDVLTARSILVSQNQPVRVHMIGTVTDYSPGVSITIQAMDGKKYTFTISLNTNILPTTSAASLTIGSHVTIVALRDTSAGQSAALGIVLLPVSQ